MVKCQKTEIAWEGEAPAEPCAGLGTRLGGSLALPDSDPELRSAVLTE